MSPWLGNKVSGDAKYWYSTAKASKLPTGSVPVPRAVFVNTRGYYGHVGVVTKVINRTTFRTREMNGGRLINPAAGITDEFNEYHTHTQYTGPHMKFIYRPGTQPGALKAYAGHIVQWKGDRKSQKTAWLVGSDLRRRWIPDIATYNCLKARGAPGPDVLSSAVLNRLKDLKGTHAACTLPPVKKTAPPDPTPTPGPAPAPAPEPSPKPEPDSSKATPSYLLKAGQRLVASKNQYLRSKDGHYRFVMQQDSNLVLYGSKGPLWASNTVGRGASFAIMQGDGNFVMYTSKGKPIWASNTDGHSGAHLVVQNDGNVVIYKKSKPLWATGTDGRK